MEIIFLFGCIFICLFTPLLLDIVNENDKKNKKGENDK